ncbi:MAG: 1-deoxy-D-xylulose-5-phosphate synthase, partial [Rhodocyclaceae bacterium]|nr:1-deoxy-D-xylulose-5-phosphate synthase [Rhodocyclaceae bacterium]
NLRKIKGPRFLHIVTRKGQGYKLAEADPILYHGVSRFDHTTGIAPAQPSSASPTPPACAKIFGDWLCEMAAQEERLVAITPAMREGSGMVRFAETFPERYHDVGIAEQHALTLAAGLACGGLKPVVAIYSTFLQRAYDQFVHDIALQNLPVLLAIDRAGLVGADGATHHGAFDLAFLTCIPNLTFFCPATADECRAMLTAAFQHNGPTAVRYPRGPLHTPAIIADQAMPPIEIGKAHLLRQGKRIAIAAFGTLVAPAAQAAQALDATVVNMRFAKPLDTDCLRALAAAHELIVVVEEGSVIGGVGGEIARFLDTLPRAPRILRLGLPDRFIDHGDQSRLLADCGLDAHGIQRSIEEHLKMLDAAG